MAAEEFLSNLGEEGKKFLLGKARRVSFGGGEYIYREGDGAFTAFFIEKGEVELRRREAAGGREALFDLAESGGFFGEDCLQGERRTYSARSAGKVSLLELEKKELLELAGGEPWLKNRIIEVHKQRVLEQAIALSPLFAVLAFPERRELIGKFQPVVFEAGEVIIKEGEIGDTLYLIKDGQVSVTTNNAQGLPVTLAVLKEGDFFGEVALVSDVRRTATVCALTPLRALMLNRRAFQEIGEKYPKVLEVAGSWVEKRVEETIEALSSRQKEES